MLGRLVSLSSAQARPPQEARRTFLKGGDLLPGLPTCCSAVQFVEEVRCSYSMFCSSCLICASQERERGRDQIGKGGTGEPVWWRRGVGTYQLPASPFEPPVVAPRFISKAPLDNADKPRKEDHTGRCGGLRERNARSCTDQEETREPFILPDLGGCSFPSLFQDL